MAAAAFCLVSAVTALAARALDSGTGAAQRPVGCKAHGPPLRFNGHRNRRRVALTFDDGPSDYTPGFVHVLAQMHAVGTFFEIGQNVPGHSKTMKSILDEGSEIGNHTLHHVYEGPGDLEQTNRIIERASGFKPCLFRPPGGDLSGGEVGGAASIGMTTVVWDVDTRDWTTPGSGAIYATATRDARDGSIILMHDGGGNRSETLAALPRIIRNLRRRGFKFETVTELLGGRMLTPAPPPSAPASGQ